VHKEEENTPVTQRKEKAVLLRDSMGRRDMVREHCQHRNGTQKVEIRRLFAEVHCEHSRQNQWTVPTSVQLEKIPRTVCKKVNHSSPNPYFSATGR
jgi:hypothetical protein